MGRHGIEGNPEILLGILEQYLGNAQGRTTHSDTGRQQKFVCPWDPPGKRPAFVTNLDTGMSFCFRCHKGWSLPQLLRDLNVPRRLRESAGSLVSPLTLTSEGFPTMSANVTPLPESLLAVFDTEGVSKHKWAYLPLVSAGFALSTLKRYEVGWDAEHKRYVYPVRNIQGQLMGLMGGDATGKQQQKYLLYGKEYLQRLLPEERLGSTLEKKFFMWNIDRVWLNSYTGVCTDDIIIVEGFKAALWLLQAGYHMVVALMGSYLSKWQANALMHISNRKVLFLDNDKAGIDGTEKANKLVTSMGSRPFSVLQYPERLRNDLCQPDDCSLAELKQLLGGISG